MSLLESIVRLARPKPELRYNRPIPGTTLIEGSDHTNIVIYDSRNHRVLFGGGNPDLTYAGILHGKHIAIKKDQLNGESKTYFVDEQGKILFGRKYNQDTLLLADSNSEDVIELNLGELCVGQLGKLKGTEETLIEYVQTQYLPEGPTGIFNFYDSQGRLFASNIPAWIKGEEEIFGEKDERMYGATTLCFVKVEGKLFLEIKYGPCREKSEIYELTKDKAT